MRKKYPYLEEPYVYNLNEEQQKRSILSFIDDFINQRQYVNIILLDWQENPLKEIHGIIASGSISKDGSSSVRRTCSLSCSVSKEEYDIDSMEMDFALNKKVFIEIGIKNETEYYPKYPIFWFPQGVFYINSFSLNSATSSAVNLTINLKDKMCLLNGDVGGTLPITVQFDKVTTQLTNGEIVNQTVLYYNIILELLTHWGGEDLNNIIIQDVPLRIRRVMQWNADTDIYFGPSDENGARQIYTEPVEGEILNKYSRGDRVGYVYDDFVPTSEIVGAAGDTVCTVLDTIKNQLGNYEYFYDVFGIFHFREIKNYLNINQSTILLQESSNPGRHINLKEGQFLLDSGSEKQYLIETTNDKNVYAFDSDRNITSISVTPNYDNIKNDFIVDGIRHSDNSNTDFLVRYRLVIDEKPEIVNWIKTGVNENGEDILKGNYGSFNNVLYYTYPEYYEGKIVKETNKLGFWYDNWVPADESDEDAVSYQDIDGNIKYEKLVYPAIGNMDQIYRVIENGENVFYLWTGNGYHKLYLIDENIDPSKNPDMLFVENTVVENIENSETVSKADIIKNLELMVGFIQNRTWWLDGPRFTVDINNNQYDSYQEAINKDKNKTLDEMMNFFIKYPNTLPISNIIDFINYEKLSKEDKEDAVKPLYLDIDAIESLLLDKIESLKTKEEIADCLIQYLDKEYINEESNLEELHVPYPLNLSDKDFFKRYPTLLKLSSLLNFCDGDITVYKNQEEVDSYIGSVIKNLFIESVDPLSVYQIILDAITNWNGESSINESIESLLNYLVGETDILNPFRFDNYNSLPKVYIKDKENKDNVYNQLQNILNNYQNKIVTISHESAFYKEILQPISETEYNIQHPIDSSLSQEEQSQASMKRKVEYLQYYQNFPAEKAIADRTFLTDIEEILENWKSERDGKIGNIEKHLQEWPRNMNTLKNLYEKGNSCVDYVLNISDQITEELKNDTISADVIKENLIAHKSLIEEFEELRWTINTNIEAIEDFYDCYNFLFVSLQSIIKDYTLKNRLVLTNQSTDGKIKLKPIPYSDSNFSGVQYPDPETGEWKYLGEYYTLDWRTYLYLYGQYANNMGTDPGPYYDDLEAFWPYEYNLNRDKQCFIDELDGDTEVQYKQLTNGNFFFDIIDASASPLGEFSVKNIGRRTDVVNDENINCLFEPEIPDIVFLNMDNPDANWSDNVMIQELRSAQDITNKLEEQRQECINNSQPYVQVSDEIFNSLVTGKYLSDAYEQIKYELFAHLKYQKVVSITALPVYYLEPNNRVTLKDYSTNIYGDYMIQNISLTLGPGANMAVTLNEVSERL